MNSDIKPESALYIGLMSGTSLDAVDAVLVDFKNAPQIIGSLNYPISPALRGRILELCHPGQDDLNKLGRADHELGQLFASSVEALLQHANVTPDKVRAIGSHGQTVRHHPDMGFTLQLGDANIICEKTGIDTVSDFRRRDLAAGGQGAPLVPAFHEALFRNAQSDRVILNIGGMANISLLPKDLVENTSGHDTGPGNVLMDAWVQKIQQQPCDINGQWAATGNINPGLLVELLSDAYFQQPPPKSTGRERFNLPWLEQHLLRHQVSAVDVQTTLTEFTARSIANDILASGLDAGELLLCGGGANNTYLVSRIQSHLPQWRVQPTESIGIEGDWLEAVAFAWLAKNCIDRTPGNLPTVTGAKGRRILGAIYQA